MFVGYDDAGEQACPYSDLDEYLCEYVDGEMDPAVRAAFEEILSRDPALAEHVECLRHTRALLCTFSHGIDTPCGFQARLRQEISREMFVHEAPVLVPSIGRLSRVAALASVLALAVTVGFYTVEDRETGSPLVVSGSDSKAPAPDTPAPLFWSVAPTRVRSEPSHYRVSYEQGYPQLTHTLHTHSAAPGDLTGTLYHGAAFQLATVGGAP